MDKLHTWNNNPALQEMVVNGPIEETAAHCPACESTDIEKRGTVTTLVGFGPEWPDPNHKWTDIKCNACGLCCTREEKSGNVWYTKDNVILIGVPNCFESYVYTCKCSGRVTRKHTTLDGITPVQTLSYTWENGVSKKHFKTFYSCGSCNKIIEVDE